MIYYFHGDHLGSSTFLTDFNGQAYEFVLYLPWGEQMAQQKVAGFSTPYRFTGKELDSETGLYYFGARYYDPTMSVWHGVDPLAEKYPGWSPYNYTMNNPLNMIDPDGRSPDWIDNGDGTFTAQKGDSAWSLAKDAKISPTQADKIVQDFHGCNYAGQDGELKSNIDPGDKVRVRDGNTGNANNTNSNSNPKQSTSSNPLPQIKSDGLRKPDFYNLNISIAIPNPVTATAVGWNMSLSIDRHGQTFFSPLGFGVGKSATMVSGSLSANWLNQSSTPNKTETYNFLSGHGINAGGGYYIGGSMTVSPTNSGTKTAFGVGFYTPQVGASYNYTPDSYIKRK